MHTVHTARCRGELVKRAVRVPVNWRTGMYCPVPGLTARRRVWGISALGPAGKNKDAVDSPLNGQSIRETKLKLGIKIRDTDHREIERERRLSAPVKFPSSTAV
ncbi:hypothetical protein BHM03_00024754 [Ensete ventricosum]|nr:hypothetical protein BHM03_00024754 [Ensete ventricosum]